MEDIVRDLVRIVLVPLLIMLGGFLLEMLAIRARGVRKGTYKFKLWLRRADGSLHHDAPCNIGEIARRVRSRDQRADRLVDIIQLASFEDYTGLSFDLCISAFTTDIVVLLNQRKVAQVAPWAAGTIAFHFLSLVWVTVLVTANQRMGPDQPETRAKRRTVQAIVLGFFTLVSGFIMLWGAL